MVWTDWNTSFTFQAVKNLSVHPTYLRLELFGKFFGDFWEINSFSGLGNYVGSISAAFSFPVYVRGKERGLLSRTAAGNRAW